MTTAAEQKLMDVKFKLDMYYAAADTAENTLEKIQDVLNPNVKLMDNQQLVLEWLRNSDNSPFALVSALDDDFVGIETVYSIPTSVREAFEKLNKEEQFKVLAAFAEWGMKNEQ